MNSEDFLKDIFLSGDLSDVRVIVENKMGQKWSFPSHSFVLKRTSSVFAKMLESDFAEGQSKTITITDFKASHVKQFFKYLYTRTLPETYTSLYELVKLAHKYMVQSLVDMCESALLDFVNLQNIYELCSLAELYTLKKLRGNCLSLMKRAAFKLLKLDDLECLSEEFMKDVVSANDLNITNEVEVFWAIWKWGSLKVSWQDNDGSDENIREFIKELARHVRWSLVGEDQKERIESLGIKMDDADLQNSSQARVPSIILTTLFLNQCNVLNLVTFASSKDHNKSVPVGNCLLHLVSLADKPFYVVGVVFACTAGEDIVQKLICRCESASADAYIYSQNSKYICTDFENKLQIYEETLCEFSKPLEICKNQTLTINCSGTSSTFGCLELKFDRNNILSYKERNLCIGGPLYGIRQLFLL